MLFSADDHMPRLDWFRRPDGSDGLNSIHGLTHTLRVAQHTAEISEAIGLTEQESKAAFQAALWHDIGRTNDRPDYYHGAKSAGKVVGMELHVGLDTAIVELALYAVTHHCGSEEHAERGAAYTSDPEATLRVLRVLKDADALDRVRLGDLDPRFLRYEFSKSRINRALELLEVIR